MTNLDPTRRVRAFYRQYAPRYDQQAAYYDRVLLGDGRPWACAQSRGAVLEVAIGTGRNLPYYPRDRRLTGIDLTPAMLTLARDRARDLAWQQRCWSPTPRRCRSPPPASTAWSAPWA
jgi:SAM-dependent methyltransferase